MSLIETRPTQLSYSKQYGWRGYVTFITEKGNERAYCQSLLGSVYAGISGEEAPKASRIVAVWEPEGVPDVSMIRVYFETPRQKGKGRLLMRGQYTYRLPKDMTMDLSTPPKIIKGPDPKEGYWQPVVKSGPYPIVIVQTADKQINIDKTLECVGTTNQKDHPKIFGAKARQLYLLRVDLDYKWGDDLVYIDYYCAYNPEGWDKVCKAVKGVWVVEQRDVYKKQNNNWVIDEDQEPREVLVFKPMKRKQGTKLVDCQPEDRVVIKEKDWTFFAGLTVW